MLLRVLALASLMAGCSSETAPPRYFDPTSDVYVSLDFTSEQADTILEAIDSWREATAGAVDLRARLGAGSPQIRPAHAGERRLGEFVPSEWPEIILDVEKASTARELRPIVLHELGHALGLPHIDRVDSVMFPYATWLQELDHWTVEAWQRLNASVESATVDSSPSLDAAAHRL